MIPCPSFPLVGSFEADLYFTILSTLSMMTIATNVYTIYAIIFHSTVHMQKYKWYLLGHQIAALSLDFYVNTLMKPLLLFPFPMALVYGIAKFLPHRHIFSIAVLLECLNFMTLAILFVYRYTVVKNYSNYPPHIILFYCASFIVAVYYNASVEIGYDEEIDGVYKNYSCLQDGILSHPDLLFYNTSSFKLFVILPSGICIIYCTILAPLLARSSYKAIGTRAMSERVKKMQRGFLRQLIYQTSIPFIVLFVPLLYVYMKVYNFSFDNYLLSQISLCSVSTYSMTESAVLIVMNKNYYMFVVKFVKTILRAGKDRLDVSTI